MLVIGEGLGLVHGQRAGMGLAFTATGTERVVDQLSKSTEVPKFVDNLMKAPELAVTMQQFSKEMIELELKEEMVKDMVDSTLDSEDIEDDIEDEVDNVLAAVAAETSSQLPAAARAQMIILHSARFQEM
ncbi:hypothetical protein ABZP36_002380 [Zizania latifolia]